ncbi:BMA-CKR-1 [Dirofilaria immitis]|nr:BMA-CKR-1 [Dirofilaria immitis]
MECIPQFTRYNIFITLCFTAIFILSLLGNSVVVLVITKLQRRTTRSITNMLLLNLAVADLLSKKLQCAKKDWLVVILPYVALPGVTFPGMRPNLNNICTVKSLICIPPTLMSEISRCWLLGPYVCKFAAYLQRDDHITASGYISAVTVCASAYTLALIALERYYAICRPLESIIWLSKRRLLALISFVWLTAFASNIGAFVIYDAIPYRTHWSCRSTATPLTDFLYQIHVTLVSLLLTSANDSKRKGTPPSVMCNICREECQRGPFPGYPIIHFVSIINFFNRASTFQSSISSRTSGSYECGYMLRSNRQEKIIEAKRRVIRMLIIIVIAFVICWTPSFIWWLIVRTADLVRIHLWNRRVNTYITLLTHISACANPITYCFMNERFRKNISMYLWGCTYQTYKEPLQGKSPPNQYALRRVKFMTQCSGDLFSNESNEDQAIAFWGVRYEVPESLIGYAFVLEGAGLNHH